MNMTLTKNEKNTFKACKDAYFFALAYHKTIETIDKESKQAVLDSVVFNYAKREEGERIKNPHHSYLMSNKDSKDFWQFCHEERTKRGLKVPDAETTSDFESWELLRLAEDNFINYALGILPEPLKTQMKRIKKHRALKDKFLDLICKLDITTIKERRLIK